jgi:xanthosine utilization system XapX-like protein
VIVVNVPLLFAASAGVRFGIVYARILVRPDKPAFVALVRMFSGLVRFEQFAQFTNALEHFEERTRV